MPASLILVDKDGVEPPQSETGGLQPLELANAQPIQCLVEITGIEPVVPLGRRIYSPLHHH